MEPAAPKEAPPTQPQPAAEEDGMLSATAAMARDAAVQFQSRRYAECAEVLAQLLLKKEGDLKVRDSSSAFCFCFAFLRLGTRCGLGGSAIDSSS
jgi:hypothetical protein